MEWTKEKPVVDGWYWAIDETEDIYAIEVIQVVKNASEHYVLSSEHDGRDDIDNWDWFLGPLVQPELPW